MRDMNGGWRCVMFPLIVKHVLKSGNDKEQVQNITCGHVSLGKKNNSKSSRRLKRLQKSSVNPDEEV